MTEESADQGLLAIVPTEFEAELIVAALDERGVEARASGALTSGFRAEAPGGVRVIVHPGDVVRARKALDELRKEQSEIDWSKVDVGDPE